jgi:hypothetical protein
MVRYNLAPASGDVTISDRPIVKYFDLIIAAALLRR